MPNTSSSNPNWIQLSIFDVRPFEKKKRVTHKKRRCTRCEKTLSIEEFGIKRHPKRGERPNSQCKSCCREIEKLRRLSPIQVKQAIPDGHRQCKKCGNVLPLERFCKAEGISLRFTCKPCESKRGSEKYQKRKNRERGKVYFAYKQCTKCSRYAEVEEFYSSHGTLNGIGSWCRDCCREHNKKYVHNNRAKVSYYSRKRRLLRINATPQWVNHEEIIALHEKAVSLTRKTGIRWELDHAIPLKNPLVCGFHVTNNLQILTKSENSSKNNRFTPYVWSDLTPEQQQSPLYNPFWK